MRRNRRSHGPFGRLLPGLLACALMFYAGASLHHDHALAPPRAGSVTLAGKDPGGCLACNAFHQQIEVWVAPALLHSGVEPETAAPVETDVLLAPPHHALHFSRAPPLC